MLLISKNKKGVIRFGLAAVKGVGEKAVKQIIAAREKTGRFQSLFHFCENVDLRRVNKRVLEALIKARAFDSLGHHQRSSSHQDDRLRSQQLYTQH